MDTQLQNSNPDGPIIRLTAADRVATFEANSNSIYNKYTPFTANSIGPSQPFVYTKISDSTLSKNLTKYDSPAFPIGSTVRDLKRIGQYSVTGNGLLYLGKQLLMQNTNAFNETRIYNPLSLLKATAKPGSLGLIDYPQRHLETSGGILNFFKDALLSTIGIQSKNLSAISTRPIDGTATGKYSNYADKKGGARAGVLRYNTAERASTKFNEVWVSAGGGDESSGKFLKNLGNALLKKLTSLIPSTNPLGAFGGKIGTNWEYRPEYQAGKDGIYYSFLSDNSGFLKSKTLAYPMFYNGTVGYNTPLVLQRGIILGTIVGPRLQIRGEVKTAKEIRGEVKTAKEKSVSEFHKYAPAAPDGSTGEYQVARLYASIDDVKNDTIGMYGNNINNLYDKMLAAIESPKLTVPQQRGSAERYSEVKVTNPDGKETSYPTYKDIPGGKSANRKYTDMVGFSIGIENANWFSKSNGLTKVPDGYTTYKFNIASDLTSEDKYNALEVLPLYRGEAPRELTGGMGVNASESRDLIFFYFYDLINKVYVPFRATITGLGDQHSADWETISYIGRADKLFLYKGFSRDVNFSFTVYANSALEMLPMWNRINYLVGFTKPSKYTGKGEATQTVSGESPFIPPDYNLETSGKESRFIYPPMITLRLGDLFYDQPCVMQSVSVTIPEDTNWESLRSDNYSYMFGPNKSINLKDVKSRQLPMKVDVSVQLKLMEKQQALGSDAHYGNASYGTDGKETGRWLL